MYTPLDHPLLHRLRENVLFAAGPIGSTLLSFNLTAKDFVAYPGTDREVLVEFMAAGYNPTFNLPLDADEDTRDRLRSLVALIFNMPDFVWR